MPPAIVYHPFVFYIITIGLSLVAIPMVAYLNSKKAMLFLILNLCVPFITAISMIYISNNDILVQDFWERLVLFRISPDYLMIIFLLMPCVVLLSTALSLLFGYSSDQFLFANELSVAKGWRIIGVIIPLLLAPILEELGWRGYGVDSLRAYMNLFNTSVVFGFLWALWHLPAFFIKGYYQQRLLSLGKIYVINFFVSVFIAAILMNWVYYKTGRSIPAVILFHFMLNLSMISFKTENFTKCIVTVLLFFISIIVIFYNSEYFFFM